MGTSVVKKQEADGDSSEGSGLDADEEAALMGSHPFLNKYYRLSEYAIRVGCGLSKPPPAR